MKDFEIVVLQLLMPACGPPCQFLWGFPTGQVLVVGFNDEWLLYPDEVGVPVF